MSLATILIVVGLLTMVASGFVTKPISSDWWNWRVAAIGLTIHIAGCAILWRAQSIDLAMCMIIIGGLATLSSTVAAAFAPRPISDWIAVIMVAGVIVGIVGCAILSWGS